MPRKQKIDRKSGMVALRTITVEPREIELDDCEGVSDDLSSNEKSFQNSQTGVILSTNVAHQYLKVTFLEEGGRLFTFDFSEFLHRREIAIAFAEAFHANGLQQVQATRKKVNNNLRIFFSFLNEYELKNSESNPIIFLNQITTSLLNAYVTWLDTFISVYKDEECFLAEGTKAGRLAVVRETVIWLKQYRSTEMADCELPYNPWSGRAKRTEPRTILSKPDQQALEQACLKEIEAIWSKFEYGCQLIEKYLPILPDRDQSIDLTNLGVCLAYIKRYYDGFLPRYDLLEQEDDNLFKAVKRHHGGQGEMNQYFFPSIRMLLPFIIFIASRTFANIDSLLTIERDCVRDHPILTNRKTIRWFKARANREQKRSYDTRKKEPSSVLVLIDRVQRMTSSLVTRVEPWKQNRLFLYHTRLGEVNSFDEFGSGNHTLTMALRDFCDTHGLKKISFSNLRSTGSDRVDEVMRGDIKARQIALNHVSIQTTESHYTSRETRQRNSERIAELQMKLVEWVRTNGKVDPRIVAKDLQELTEEQASLIANGSNATTSGFICKNPLDSPQEGEVKGRLCSAWLGCFICSNAIIVLDAETLARLLQVEAHLIKARTKIAPVRFELLYTPKLHIIQNDLIPQFVNPVIYLEAKELLPSLTPLPEIE